MDLWIALIKGTVSAFFAALDLCMLLRALLSWFADESNPILGFVTAVTEPVIIPVRALCDRFGWFRNFPLDMPFMITFLLLQILGAFFGSVF